MTTREELRLRLQDYLKVGYDEATGDGETKIWRLSYSPIQDYQITINDVAQTEGSDYTIDENSGYVIFTTAPADEDIIKMQYNWAAFTDDELDTILDKFSSDNDQVLRAAIFALRIVLVNAAKRFNYTQGEIKIEASQVFKQIKEMIEMYQEELKSESGSATMAKREHSSIDDDERKEVLYDLRRWSNGYLKRKL